MFSIPVCYSNYCEESSRRRLTPPPPVAVSNCLLFFRLRPACPMYAQLAYVSAGPPRQRQDVLSKTCSLPPLGARSFVKSRAADLVSPSSSFPRDMPTPSSILRSTGAMLKTQNKSPFTQLILTLCAALMLALVMSNPSKTLLAPSPAGARK